MRTSIFIASKFLFDKAARISSTKPLLFSTETPVRSPKCATVKEVTDWFKTQSSVIQQGFRSTDQLTIVEHHLALSDYMTAEGFVKKGQVLFTKTHKVYSFSLRKWL